MCQGWHAPQSRSAGIRCGIGGYVAALRFYTTIIGVLVVRASAKRKHKIQALYLEAARNGVPAKFYGGFGSTTRGCQRIFSSFLTASIRTAGACHSRSCFVLQCAPVSHRLNTVKQTPTGATVKVGRHQMRHRRVCCSPAVSSESSWSTWQGCQ